ncbi:glycosyltransferase [Rhizobium giardinii]|nr:glycosyltransferase [Rhizobium giardinii]
MHFCLITEEFQGLTWGGGIGVCFAGLAKSLASRGHKVDVVITNDASVSQSFKQMSASLKDQGIIVRSLIEIKNDDIKPGLHRDHILKSFEISQFLLNNHYDCVHFHEYLGLGLYTTMARHQGLLPNTIVVTQTHGSTEWVRRHNMFLPDISILEIEGMERRQIEQSDFVASPSQYMLDWYAENGVKLPANGLINWLLPRWLEKTETPVELTTRPIAPGQLKELIFFGRHEPRKGIEIFVEAVKRLSGKVDLDITFLGRFDMIDRENSVSYILRHLRDFPGRLTFLGDYTQDRAHRLMLQRPDALCVMPSLIENSPCTVGEALTLGLPFLASDVGGTHELIRNESRDDALVKPVASALAEKILKIAEHGQPAVSAALDPVQIADRWEKLHADLQATIPARVAADDKPLVSIIVTHYERPDLVTRAVEHLFAQTYENIEIILVDDGSPRSTTQARLDELETKYGGERFRVIRSANRYLGAARNLGASHARGTYLMFHDDDNIAEPQEVETFVKAALTGGFEILTAQSFIFFDHDHPELGKIEYFPIGIGGDFSFFRNRFGDANALILKETFDRVGGFSEHYGVGWEDWEFFLRAHVHGARMGIVPVALFRYFASGTGMLASGLPRLNNFRIFDAVRHMKPVLSADLLQLARRDEVGQQILDRTWWGFEKMEFRDIHRKIMGFEPNSDDALILLVELAFNLGRIDDAVALGMTKTAARRELAKIVSASVLNRAVRPRMPYIAEHCDVPEDDDIDAYRLSGWIAGPDMLPVQIVGATIGDTYFRVVSLKEVVRYDVYEAYERCGLPNVGFDAYLLASEQPMPDTDGVGAQRMNFHGENGKGDITLYLQHDNPAACVGWLEALSDLAVCHIDRPNAPARSATARLEICVSNNPKDIVALIGARSMPLVAMGDGYFDANVDMTSLSTDDAVIRLLSPTRLFILDAVIYHARGDVLSERALASHADISPTDRENERNRADTGVSAA